MCYLIFFFFSSRRRHTRCGRDWSSDVCSSDLRWLAEELVDAAPRIPVRDRATLRAHYPGRTDEEIAEALVKHASRATAGIGAAAGAVAGVEYFAPPTLLAIPVQLAAETLAVAAVEIKLVAELHEAGRPAGPRVAVGAGRRVRDE